MKAVAFDAYGTLFDVFSITALGEELFPGKGDALAQLWRLKQLQYSMLRSLMGRHRDFWRLTEDAILSNGEPKMLEAAARSAGIIELLDAILSVEEVKIFKPSPRVYHLAPEHLGVRPAELGFVSSNGWDVAGAGSVGLEAFWIQRRAAEPPEQLGFTADHTVGTITDLVPLLRG
jgi:2-haloacid dehalogenase